MEKGQKVAGMAEMLVEEAEAMGREWGEKKNEVKKAKLIKALDDGKALVKEFHGKAEVVMRFVKEGERAAKKLLAALTEGDTEDVGERRDWAKWYARRRR